MKVRDMTAGKPMRLILATALPLMLGNVFQQLYTLVDASVVGHGIGLEALAALGSADWFNWMFLSITIGFAHGFSIPIAHAFGAKDYHELRRCAGSAVTLGLLTVAAITAAALVSVQPVLAWMRTPAEVRPTAAAYLRVLFTGLPVVMVYNLLAGILRALGDSRSPLAAMVLASLTNIALDVLFVLGFGWGVESAAAATVISQGASCTFCLLRLHGVDFMRLHREDFRPDRSRWARLMRLGAPLSGQNCIISIGGMIVQTIVNPMGVAFIAGYTSTNKLYGLLELAAVSYGHAITTYTGQNLGARRLDRIRDGMRAGLAAGIATALSIMVLMLCLGHTFISMFIEDSPMAPRAMGIAQEYLRLMSICLPVLYLLYVYRSTLQGMGNTVMPMVSGLAELVMRTGAALLLPPLIGYSGVFWAEVLAWLGATLILVPSCYAMLGRLQERFRQPSDGSIR